MLRRNWLLLAAALVVSAVLVIAIQLWSWPRNPDASDREKRVELAAGGVSGTAPMIDESTASSRVALEPSDDLLFVVTDVRTEGISGASIEKLSDSGRVRLAITGITGTAHVESAATSGGADIVVSAPGYATSVLEPDQIDGPVVRVTLHDGGSISGLVVTQDGSPPRSKVLVSAVPSEIFFVAGQASKREELIVSIHSVEVDRSGRFRIDGLENGAVYTVDAAGANYVSASDGMNPGIRATAEGVELRLSEIVGAELEFTCRDPEYLSVHFSAPATRTKSSSAVREYVGWRRNVPLVRSLRQLDVDSASRIPLVYIAVSDVTSSENARRIQYSGAIPGFEEFKSSFELASAMDGRFPRVQIELTPNASAFGKVELSLSGSCAALAADMGFSASLKLTSDGRGAMSFPVRWKPGDRLAVVGGVPVGTYSWEFNIEAGWIRIPPSSVAAEALQPSQVSVESDVVTPFEMAVPDLGYLLLECHDADGPVLGAAVLTSGASLTKRGGSKWVRTISCRETPQVIGPLPPGSYEVLMYGPRQPAEGAHSFQIRSGESHREVIVLP